MSKELDEITKDNITYFLKKIFTSNVFGFDKPTDFYERAGVYFDNQSDPCGIISCLVSCQCPKYDDAIHECELNLSYADYQEIDAYINDLTFFWHRYNLLHSKPTKEGYTISMQRS